MPATSVDLEVILSWVSSAKGFLLSVLYKAPDDYDYDYRYFSDRPVPIELERLRELSEAGIDDYGVALGEMLFPVADARRLLHKAVIASTDQPVHLRLVIDPKAPADYQAIRWETLCEPGSRLRLTTTPRIRFSRFLSEAESRQPTPLPRPGALRALIAVANPSNVAAFVAGPVPLGDIQVTAEVERAREALADLEIVEPVLSGEADDPARRATRENLLEALRKDVHLLYLVCHGRITEPGARNCCWRNRMARSTWLTEPHLQATWQAWTVSPPSSCSAPASLLVAATGATPRPMNLTSHVWSPPRNAYSPSPLRWHEPAWPSWSACRETSP